MGFAYRFDVREAIVKDSLKHMWMDGRKIGYQVDVQLVYYRGHWLSTIDEFELKIDGETVPEEIIKFCVNGKEFSICQLESCYTEFWEIMEPATLKVWLPGSIAEGEHDVDLHLIFRSPYMPIGPNHQYMPVDSCGQMKLTIQ